MPKQGAYGSSRPRFWSARVHGIGEAEELSKASWFASYGITNLVGENRPGIAE